jgi:hypothetical protein
MGESIENNLHGKGIGELPSLVPFEGRQRALPLCSARTARLWNGSQSTVPRALWACCPRPYRSPHGFDRVNRVILNGVSCPNRRKQGGISGFPHLFASSFILARGWRLENYTKPQICRRFVRPEGLPTGGRIVSTGGDRRDYAPVTRATWRLKSFRILSTIAKQSSSFSRRHIDDFLPSAG